MRIAARLILVVIFIGVASWLRYSRTHSGGATSAGGVPIVQVPDNDPHLILATAQAKKEWPQFVAAYKAPTGKHGFAVKTGFHTKTGGIEYMWLMVTALDDKTVIGTLDDQPVNDIGHKEGDAVTVRAEDIEDWVYVEGAKMVGGFSIPVMNDMAAEQKSK